MMDDLRTRLARTRRLTTPWRDDGSRGVTDAALGTLLDAWSRYDWAPHQQRLDGLPWQSVTTRDGELRLIHRRSGTAGAPAVMLLHGWPDSVLRFERVLPLLSDAHVLVPALPGYPFSAPLEGGGMSCNRIAGMVADAIDELGYDRVVLSGGDVGGAVAEILAAERPDLVSAIHLTNVAAQHAFSVDPETAESEVAAHLRTMAAWFRTEGGYIAEQSTRPATLAVALGDSPAGLAAWIVEKLERWSDASSFTVDDLITWVMAYWTTGTIGTSFSTYAEPAVLPSRIPVPAVFSAFPRDIKPDPRAYVELFLDVREFITHDRGGHFAAWEQPTEYVSDLRRAMALGL